MPPAKKKPTTSTPVDPDDFMFTGADGESHTLPAMKPGTLKGRALRDAVMGGEVGQMAYMFAKLESVGADQLALDALYDLPEADMMTVIRDWGEHGAGGVSLGE